MKTHSSISWCSSTLLGQNRSCSVCCSKLKFEDETACELVNGSEITIGDAGDMFHAYLFKAVKNNNGIGILLLSDIFGFEDSFTRDFAYRVACIGYNVLVPDLFRGDPFPINQPMSSFEQWLARQDPEQVESDIAASTKWMADEFLAAGIPNKLGLIGFCYGGGRLVEALARDQGLCFGTGVSFYGTRVSLNAAANVKVPVLLVAGDNDFLCPVNVVIELERIIGRGSKALIFKGRGHGFAHRPDSAEDADAEQAFMFMRNWLSERLLGMGQQARVSRRISSVICVSASFVVAPPLPLWSQCSENPTSWRSECYLLMWASLHLSCNTLEMRNKEKTNFVASWQLGYNI